MPIPIKKLKYIWIASIMLIVMITASCTDATRDARLRHISDLISSQPDSALTALSKVDKNTLDEANCHYYDFLQIKASDKAYIDHKSDSLILDVIKYFKDHNSWDLYAESLYYGGRVYSDLGDTPSALDYFHKALDETEDDPSKIELRTRLYSQGGRLLGYMKMYDEATDFIKTALKLERDYFPHDTLKVYYDLQLLANTYLFANNFKQADSVIQQALKYEGKIPDDEISASFAILAEINRKSGNYGKALQSIQQANKNLAPHSFNTVKLTEGGINFEIGNFKNAYKNFTDIINNSDQQQKLGAYQFILTPELIYFLPPDSVYPYFERYRQLLNKRYRESDAEHVAFQEAHYNYFKHKREKEKAQKAKKQLIIWICILVVCVLLVLTYLLFRRIRYNQKVKELKNALGNIAELKKSHLELSRKLEQLSVQSSQEKKESRRNNARDCKKHNQDIRGVDSIFRVEMRERLSKLSHEYNEKGIQIPIESTIVKSDIYKTIEDHLNRGVCIPDNSYIWEQLYELINKVSPGFSDTLKLLLGGTIHSFDEKTCSLIKCGFGPTQISILVNRSKTAITSRRASLNSRIFDDNRGTEGLDGIIKLI